MSKKLVVPKPSEGDANHSFAKGMLSGIPGFGGPAAELFQAVVQPPLEKRRIAWMKAVGEKLHKLEEEGVSLQKLQENEEFISTVMHASQIALKTHSEEKRASLRAAILNVARGQTPDEAVQYMFFNFVDVLSELQIRILRVFQNPEPPPGMSMGGLGSVLEHNIPSLRGQRDLYDQLWKDLYLKGLVNTDGLHVTMSGAGLASRRTSGLGQQFLNFISEQL